MTLLALAIVITSAFTHASWNYLAKRVNGGTAFTVLISALAALFYAAQGPPCNDYALPCSDCWLAGAAGVSGSAAGAAGEAWVPGAVAGWASG